MNHNTHDPNEDRSTRIEDFETALEDSESAALECQEALNVIGVLVDGALDHRREVGLERAFALADELQERTLTDAEKCFLHYLLSNAWANREALSRGGLPPTWRWEQHELEQQILHLRRAASFLTGSKELDPVACRIHTNLGNTLDTIGRFVEAIEHWRRALEIDPDFGMARGNLGHGLFTYARNLYDQGHARVFLGRAHHHLGLALGSRLDPGAEEGFSELHMQLEARLETAPPADVDLDGHSMGAPEFDSCGRKLLTTRGRSSKSATTRPRPAA